MEFKIKNTDNIIIYFGLLIPISFLILGILCIILNIQDFSLTDLLLGMFSILFSVYGFIVVYKISTCQYKSLIINSDTNTLKLVNGNNYVEIPLKEIAKICSKYAFGKGKQYSCVYIHTKQGMVYSVAIYDYETLRSKLPE